MYPVHSSLSATAAMVLVSLAVSGICWVILGRTLRKVLAFLCDDPRPEAKEISGIFWQRLYLGLTLLLPLLCVLLFAPNFQQSLAANLLYALRWAIFGGVGLLLVLAFLIRQQIRLRQHGWFETGQENGAAQPTRSQADNGLPPLFK